MVTSWKTLKRYIAMVMTFVMVFSCVQMGIPAHIHAAETEPKNPGITLGEIIAGNYELSDVEKEVLKSGDLSADVTFRYAKPSDETTEEDGLVSIDRENKKVSVVNYVDEEGNTWIPKTVTIEVNGDVKETVTLKDGSGTYTFDGSAFAVVVEYVLTAGGLKDGITELQQLALMNAVIYLSQDVDYMHRLDKDVALHMEAAGQSIDMTATGFLEMMTIKNDLLGGDSPINMLYSLVEGYNESFTLPNGKQETITIKLEGDAVAAAESLKAQQDNNGKLDLVYFLENTSCSYLEMLYNDSYRAGLQSALNQNINDVEGLLAEGGLDDLYQDLVVLNSNLLRWERDAYREINNRYYDIVDVVGPILDDEEVNNIEDLKAVQAAVDAYYADALKNANDKLDAEIEAGNLKEEWVPENGIQSAADLKTLIDKVRSEYDAGIAEINSLLDSYRAETGIDFPVVKESKHIAYIKADLDEYIVENLNTLNKTVEQYNNEYNLNLPTVSYTGLDSLEETAADVQELRTALADAKGYMNNALTNANAELDRLGYEGADVTNADQVDAIIIPWQTEVNLATDAKARALTAYPLLFDSFGISYPGTISSSKDVDTAIEWLNGMAGDEAQAANALVAEKRAALNAILSDVNALLGRYGYGKTITKSGDITAATRHFNGKPSPAEKYIWGRVNDGLNGYITINSVDDVPGAKDAAKLIYESGTYADFTEELYNEFLEKVDEAVARVNAIPTVKSDLTNTYKPALQTAEAELKAAEDALGEVGGDIATLISYMRTEQAKVVEAENTIAEYQAKIDSAMDVKAQLQTVIPTLDAIGEAEEILNDLYDTLVAAPDTVAKLDEAEAMMKAAEDALDVLDGYYANMQEADEAVGMLRNAVDALEKLEYYKGLLDNYLLALPMLIDVFYSFVDYLNPVANRFARDRWTVKNHVNADADFAMLTAAAEKMIGKSLYTAADLKPADELIVATANTQFNMSMYTVKVVYKASVVNPLLVDSDELYELVPYQATETITLEAGASAEQVMAEILALKAEEAALAGWSGYGVNATDFIRTETELPATLNQNFTYEVTFAPKTLNIAYQGMTGPATVLFGHRISLPASETEGKEYTYMINGKLHYQGEVVTLTEDATIVRKEADASADRNLLDVVVNATSVSDAVKKVLSSSALSYAESVKIRFPSAALMNVDLDEKVLTANRYNNAIGDKAWVALNAVTKDVNGNVLEILNSFVNDKAAYNAEFAIAEVLYQIAFSAADVNTTDEKILAAMNFANVLVDEYIAQKEALDFLASDSLMNALAMLDANDSEIIGYLNLAQAGLGADPAAKAALKIIVDDLNNSGTGKLMLYNHLFNYNEQGMSYYYKNDVIVRDELAKMQNAMNTLTSSDTFMDLVQKNSPDLYNKLLGIKDSLLAANIPAKSGNILVDNDAALKQLVADLDAYAQTGKTEYTTVGQLKWQTTLNATVGIKIVTINVSFGTQTNTLKIGFSNNSVLDEKDIQDMLSKLAALEAEMGIDGNYFVCEGDLPKVGDVMNENLTEEELTYNLVWTAKNFDVVVGGETLGSVSIENPYFFLPSHSDPAYSYKYIIGGVTYAQGTTVNLTDLIVSGNLTIERQVVDKIRDQMLNFVNSMKGALTLVEHGDRQYSLVLKVDPATISTDMSNFAMGMLMSGYNYIGMDGKMFYGAMTEDGLSQFHLQAMIDMIMNSGMGTDSILGLYGANGFNNIKLNGQIISAKGGNINALGGKLMQSTMSFGDSAETALEVNFYVTMPNSSTVKQLHSAIQSSKGLISIALQNGRLEASVNLPDQVYAAYLAALSVVGETDLHSIEEVNAQIALGYLFTLIDPILYNENISTDTFENTLAMFGQKVDLSAYASTYKQMQGMLSEMLADRTYSDAGVTVSINNLSINRLIDWVQSNVIAKLAAGFGVSPDDIKLSTMIYEYQNKDDAEDRDDYGLDVKIYAELANINTNYAALFISPSGSGVANKIGMLTAEEVAAGALANLRGTSYVILLADINSNLVTNGTMLIDLNGKTINGSFKANGTAYLMDNSAAFGGVTGKLSGNIKITDGKFGTDVTAYLPSGYVQEDDGTVTNKLYTISADGNNNVTVTIHTNFGNIRELMNTQSAASMGLDIMLDLLMNHYNMAALSMGPADGELYKVFDYGIADILGLLSSDNLLVDGANTVLGWNSLSDLADLHNAIADDLTDFGAIAEALKGDGVIATYKMETAAWQVGMKHVEDGDYMTLFLTSNEKKEQGSLSIALDGALIEELKVLYSALDKTMDVDSELDFNDLMIDENGHLQLDGSYKGTVEIDFTSDRNYVVTLAVILAHGNASIRDELVAAIKAYYASGETSLVDLQECFEDISAAELFTALANHNRATNFYKMLKDLGLNGIVDEDIDATEMGYSKVIDVVGFIIRELKDRGLFESVFGNGRELGSFKKTDWRSDYYGFTTNRGFDKNFGPVRGYSAGVDFAVSELSFKLRLFNEKALVVVTNAAGLRIGEFDNLEEAFALANVEHGSTITVIGGVVANNDLLVSTDINLFGVKRIQFADGAQILLNGDNVSLTTDMAIDNNVAVSSNVLYCMTIAQDGSHTIYTAHEHFDSPDDRDHVCDYGCGLEMEDCRDNDGDGKCDICGADVIVICIHVDNNKNHYCDNCGAKLSDCYDNDNDHLCDYCKTRLSNCSDNDKNHYCDYCGEKLSDCYDTNKDHFCDLCGAKLSNCYDTNKDHLCDYCGTKLSDCSDDNKDHFCDLCGAKLSNCSDANKDHLCDYCGDKLSDCYDSNDDGKCDICGKFLKAPEIGKIGLLDSEELAFGYKVGTIKDKNGNILYENILYLDLNRNGVTVDELERLMAATEVKYDADGKVAIEVKDFEGYDMMRDNTKVMTGAKITVIAQNPIGTATAEYTIVVIGDVNHNGRIENNDATKITLHYINYTGNEELDAKNPNVLKDLNSEAADTNRNGRVENNDIVLNATKYVTPVKYTSHLKSEEEE